MCPGLEALHQHDRKMQIDDDSFGGAAAMIKLYRSDRTTTIMMKTTLLLITMLVVEVVEEVEVVEVVEVEVAAVVKQMKSTMRWPKFKVGLRAKLFGPNTLSNGTSTRKTNTQFQGSGRNSRCQGGVT